MLLSAKLLNNVGGVNSFDISQQTSFTEGDLPVIYIRLFDKQSKLDRYSPSSGATLSVTLTNVDTNKSVTKVATQPFSSDGSIWSFSFLSTENVKGTISLMLLLTEGASVTRGLVGSALLVQPFNAAYV
jgi:hypothetical protein